MLLEPSPTRSCQKYSSANFLVGLLPSPDYLKVVYFVVQDEISCNEPLSRIIRISPSPPSTVLFPKMNRETTCQSSAARVSWTTKEGVQCIEPAEIVHHKGEGLVLNICRVFLKSVSPKVTHMHKNQ